MVRSVVSELSVGEVDVLRWARAQGGGGGWTVQGLAEGLRWDRRRAEDVTRRLVGSGMVWMDQAGGKEEDRYFFYSLFIEQCTDSGGDVGAIASGATGVG